MDVLTVTGVMFVWCWLWLWLLAIGNLLFFEGLLWGLLCLWEPIIEMRKLLSPLFRLILLLLFYKLLENICIFFLLPLCLLYVIKQVFPLIVISPLLLFRGVYLGVVTVDNFSPRKVGIVDVHDLIKLIICLIWISRKKLYNYFLCFKKTKQIIGKKCD